MKAFLRANAVSIVLCVLTLAVFAWHVSLFDTLADDAYVTYRYSRNLARGVLMAHEFARSLADRDALAFIAQQRRDRIAHVGNVGAATPERSPLDQSVGIEERHDGDGADPGL